MLTCEICGKQFERQFGGGNLTEGGTAFKCPECAAKNLESTPSPRGSSRADAAAFSNELDRVAPATPVVTYSLIAICTAVFVIEILKGAGFDTMSVDLAIRLGANYGPQTLSGQWWRLISAMFLHFGFFHLLMNMWCLYALGSLAERLMGRAAFSLLYFATGLGGGLLSLAVHPQLVSAGASGAVFGITGGLVAYMALKKAPLSLDSMKKELRSLGIFVAYNLFYSLRPGVDMMAHAGGLASGLIIAAALPRYLETPGAQPAPSPIQENSSLNKKLTQIGMACAIVALLAAVGIHRMQSDSLYVLASLDQIDAGKSADVIPTLEKIVARQPNSALAHFALGAACIQTNRGTDAVRELTRADSLQPGNAGFEQELGAAYLSQNDFTNAITNFRASLAQQSNNDHARIGLAAALFGNTQYQEAATEARTILTASPNDSNAHSILGQAEVQLGAVPDGIHEMETALQLDPKNSELRAHLLSVYQTTGRTTQYRNLAAQSSAADTNPTAAPVVPATKPPTDH
jgi:membrane associated rhomboid family serine protease/Flp pilus assembly protein TadD